MEPSPSRRAALGLAAAGLVTVLGGCRPGRGAGRAPSSSPSMPLARSARFGAWPGGPDVVAAHHRLERVVGASLPIVSLYADWHTPWPAEVSRGLAGRDLLISWEPVGIDFAELLDGAWDTSLTTFLEAAARHTGQVMLRPFAEMNGPWQPWSVDHEDGAVRDVEQWQAAWRHLVGLARAAGSPCSFLFCANTTDEGPTPVERYWPGTEWVDAVGLDGFNWGWSADGRPQVSAEQVIGPMYDRLGRLHPTAEIVVAELGCAPSPPQAPSARANWFAELYASRAFPRVSQVVFFHEDKERDWRLDGDPVTLAVHRASLAAH